MVGPAGIEPASQVSETYILSIELRTDNILYTHKIVKSKEKGPEALV